MYQPLVCRRCPPRRAAQPAVNRHLSPAPALSPRRLGQRAGEERGRPWACPPGACCTPLLGVRGPAAAARRRRSAQLRVDGAATRAGGRGHHARAVAVGRQRAAGARLRGAAQRRCAAEQLRGPAGARRPALARPRAAAPTNSALTRACPLQVMFIAASGCSFWGMGGREGAGKVLGRCWETVLGNGAGFRTRSPWAPPGFPDEVRGGARLPVGFFPIREGRLPARSFRAGFPTARTACGPSPGMP